jgi:hypothetical protein
MTLAPRLFGPTLPAWCDGALESSPTLARWPRTQIPALLAPGQPRCLVEIAAMPTLISPFEWQVIAHTSNGYDMQNVNLLDPRFRGAAPEREAPWRVASRYPNQWTPQTIEGATTRIGRVFLGFSRFPVARTIVDAAGGVTVQLSDVRFMANGVRDFGSARPGGGRGRGGAPAAPRQAAPGLFTATVRFGADGHVVEERLGP